MRALRVLREADLILAEDTRTSGLLLKHFDIHRPMLSYHKFNEHQTVAAIVQRLQAGETIAVVSDAGTPAISDPGFLVAREAIRAGIEVSCLPGPTAFVPALVASGLPADKFCFEGFLPQKKGRQTRLTEIAAETRTLIIYESPHRLPRLLEELSRTMGDDRQAAVCRELSKVHEDIRRGTLAELAAHYAETEPRGEIVVVVAGREETPEERRERKRNINNK